MNKTPPKDNGDSGSARPSAAGKGNALPPGYLQRLSLRPTALRWIVHIGMYLFLKVVLPLLFRYRVRGRNNIPLSGAVLIVSNHASNLDPPLIGAACLRRMFRYMGKGDLWEASKPFCFMMENLGAFPVRRGAADREALRYATDLLDAGQSLVVFPEGTRTRDGSIGVAQPGVAMILSKHPNIPILPLRIDGSFEAFGRGKRYPSPHHISITFGKPFSLAPLFQEAIPRKQLYRKIGDTIMERIRQAHP